jgi:hypothetical protein
LRRAVGIRPGYVEAYHNLGSALTELGRPGEAEVWLRQAVRLCERSGAGSGDTRTTGSAGSGDPRTTRDATSDPSLAPGPSSLTASSYNQLGLALMAQAKYEAAEACFHTALRYKPDFADAHSNLGNLFQEQGRLPEAVACYDLALVHDPQSASTCWNRALAWLQAGDYERGWREYEWRWQRKLTPARPFVQPRWDGSPLSDRTLLIYMEQGLGDMFQFIRYAMLARERLGKVIIECPTFLMPLLSRCRGIDQLVAEGTPLPEFDVQVPLMSLPGLLGTTLDTVPAEVPYLFPDPELVEHWREYFQEVLAEAQRTQRAPRTSDRLPLTTHDSPLTRIGIVWQGNPHHRLDRYRSIPLKEFAPLARVPGVQLVSLQRGAGTEQLQKVKGQFDVLELPGELDKTAGAFMDTAAIMMNLDLVISVDTAAAHLAGGLGVPVWVPLSAVGEWRWLTEREDTPWYPTMRLFRQRKLGAWRPVFRRMAREVARFKRPCLTSFNREPRASALASLAQ